MPGSPDRLDAATPLMFPFASGGPMPAQRCAAARSPSLQRQLFITMFSALAVVWIILGWTAYQAGLSEADQLMDAHLASVAAWLAQSPAAAAVERTPVHSGLTGRQPSVSMSVSNAAGRVTLRSGPAPLPPAGLADGYASAPLGPAGRPWRIYTHTGQGGAKVSVLVDDAERRAMARHLATRVAAPAIWLMPILACALLWGIRRAMAPLHALGEQVRAVDRLPGALLEPSHQELRPLVHAVRALAERNAAALQRERKLVDAFAHELRTPLTSLRLHVDLLRMQLTPTQRAEAIAQIEADVQRAVATLADLLTLARTSTTEFAQAAQRFDLAALVRTVVDQHEDEARAKTQVLVINAPQRCVVQGHRGLVDLALRNLVMNAIGHAPTCTTIEVRVSHSSATIEVRDDGALHGVQADPATHLLRLGVGHRLVREVAEAHRGSFTATGPDPQGWRAYVIQLGPQGH